MLTQKHCPRHSIAVLQDELGATATHTAVPGHQVSASLLILFPEGEIPPCQLLPQLAHSYYYSAQAIVSSSSRKPSWILGL